MFIQCIRTPYSLNKIIRPPIRLIPVGLVFWCFKNALFCDIIMPHKEIAMSDEYRVRRAFAELRGRNSVEVLAHGCDHKEYARTVTIMPDTGDIKGLGSQEL